MAIEFKPQIAKVKVINELSPQRSDCTSNSSCAKTWKCAFSPNDHLFAYSSADRIVVLIKSSDLIRKRTIENESPIREQLRIDCNYLVRSLNFSLIANFHKSTAFWLRTAQFKDYFLITGHCSGRIRVWDVVSGKLLLELIDHKDVVSDISSTPNGILVSTSYDGTTKCWDLIDGGNLTHSLKTDGMPIYCCRISPDFKSLVTVGMSKTVNVWQTFDFTIRLQLNGHQNSVVGADFSPDNALIVSVSYDTTVKVWNSMNGQQLLEFNQLKPPPTLIYAGGENGNFIRSVAFAPDGYHIATVTDDSILRIWDLESDKEPEAIGVVLNGLCCTYSRSGQILAVGTRLGSVSIFEGHSCIKSLLFLCRLTIRRHLQSKSIEAKSDVIPQRLIDYLDYKY